MTTRRTLCDNGIMLTTQDINRILTAVEKVFDRSMDDKLRPLNGQFADFRKEFREFKQEMYEFKQEMYEFKGDMIGFRDHTQKILEAIFDLNLAWPTLNKFIPRIDTSLRIEA